MWRKDRSRPVIVTEFLVECYRNTDPWNHSPSRMLRHRAFIQAARLSFGLSGALDPENREAGGEYVEHEVIDDVPAPPKAPPTARRVAPSPNGNGNGGKPQQGEPEQRAASSISADQDQYLKELDEALADGSDEAEVKSIYQNWSPDATLGRSIPALDRAADHLLKHLKRVEHS